MRNTIDSNKFQRTHYIVKKAVKTMTGVKNLTIVKSLTGTKTVTEV